MIDTTLSLTRLHCNRESDFGGAEPYLWTVFFYFDLSTISGSTGLMFTHTPHQTSTTRGMFPNGIEFGDDIMVPASMGQFDVTLDGGNLGLSLIGCLFILIDERNTDADAIKAGHVAFGESAHEALNELAASKVLADDKTPTPQEVKTMAARIEDAVTAAIRDKLSWWDLLDQQDRFVGSGFKVYSDAQISAIAAGDGGTDQFVVKIRSERTVSNSQTNLFGQPPQPATVTKLIDDYDLFGTLRVSQADAAADPPGPDKDRFVDAVQVFQQVQSQMRGLEVKARRARGEARQKLLAQLTHIRKFALKAALRALGTERKAYDSKRSGRFDKTAPVDRHLCIEPDCCFEHTNQVYLNCLATSGFGPGYCKALADYHLDRCKHPNSLRPPAPPLAPAARE